MSCLVLKVDMPAGVSIGDACKDAVILATKLGIKIKFEFNDKIMYAFPYTCIESLIEAYKESIKNNSNFVCTFDKTY